MKSVQNYNTHCPICGEDCAPMDHCQHFLGWTRTGQTIDEFLLPGITSPMPITQEMIVVNTGVTARVFGEL